jgi:hypothetical protein
VVGKSTYINYIPKRRAEQMKIKIDKTLGKERFENRSKLSQIEMMGIQTLFNKELARGNLIYTDNYLYPERVAKIDGYEMLNLFMYRDSLYITAIEDEEEIYFKMN